MHMQTDIFVHASTLPCTDIYRKAHKNTDVAIHINKCKNVTHMQTGTDRTKNKQDYANIHMTHRYMSRHIDAQCINRHAEIHIGTYT